MQKKCVLIILDGWGIGRHDFSNPIYIAKPKVVEHIKNTYSAAALQASGIAVGLPWEEEGSSEVGHLTIGAGKVLYQHYPRISMAVRSQEFYKNEVLLQATKKTKDNQSTLHYVGLLSDENSHASFEHLMALMELAKREGVKKVNLHLFSDGSSKKPQALKGLLERVDNLIKEKGVGRVATICGRYYGMDQDGHWDRTKRAYQTLMAREATNTSFEAVLSDLYSQSRGEDLLPPYVFGPEAGPIRDGDAVVFFNFREDSIRQLASSFLLPNFDKFERKIFTDLFVATFTDYSDQFSAPVAFEQEGADNPLGKVLADAGKTQMLIAETEKYAHVTYFFNGYRDEQFEGQFPVLIPSNNISRHENSPEMKAEEIGNRVVQAIEDQSYDFILANFANPDVVAHSGNFDATVKAIEAVDEQLEKIVKACEAVDMPLLITSDHGNAEAVLDPMTGEKQTKHDANPVPIYAVGSIFEGGGFQDKKPAVLGILSDVAPTVLELMGLEKPKEMTGKSLVHVLRGI